MAGQRIGIYGGAFDPVHKGHIMFAERAAEKSGLDKVIFLPEREPRNKPHVTDFAHRLAMIRLAIKDNPLLAVEELVSARFSIAETLAELEDMLYGDKLVLLVGSDNVRNMNPQTWPQMEKLLKTTELAIGMRHGETEDDLAHIAAQTKVTYIYTDHARTAATKIRAGAKTLAPKPVRDYIARHSLYA